MIKQVVLACILMGVTGCSKPAEAPKMSVAPTTVVGPTTELEKMGAVKMAGPVGVSPAPKVEVPVSATPPAPVAVSVKKSNGKYVVTQSKGKSVASQKVSAKLAHAKSDEKVALVLIQAEMECARLLNAAVDKKIADDIKLGKIRDFGSVVDFMRQQGLCP